MGDRRRPTHRSSIGTSHGLQQRRRPAEFCLSLPADPKLRDGRTRVIARRATRGVMPEAVRLRSSKQNLAGSFLRCLERFGPCAGHVPRQAREFCEAPAREPRNGPAHGLNG